MDFGKLPDISRVDFTLPSDHPDTAALLEELKPSVNPRVYVGCAKWGRKDWIGKIYPPKTKESEFLDHYVKHFNCIELNATHYRIPDKATVLKWKSKAGKDFKFCPKFPQVITHIQRLRKSEGTTQEFYEAISGFGENLGTCFLQMPPNFSPAGSADLKKYLLSLPRHIHVCIEFRHPDWFKASETVEEVFALMKEHDLGTVITDTSGRRDCLHQRLTVPEAFIRFVGNNLHPTDYSRVDDWVKGIKAWLDKGLPSVYFFMHQHEEKDSPELCAYTIRELNRACGLELKEPEFLQGFQQHLF